MTDDPNPKEKHKLRSRSTVTARFGRPSDKSEEYKPHMTPKLADYLARSEQGKTHDRLAEVQARRDRKDQEATSRAAWDASMPRLRKYHRRHVASRKRPKSEDEGSQ